MADYRLGILQTDIGIVFGCMRPLVKDHPCVAAVLARISLRPDCCKIPLQCAGLNRHEAEEEEASRERTSDPLGPEFCVGHREVHGEA